MKHLFAMLQLVIISALIPVILGYGFQNGLVSKYDGRIIGGQGTSIDHFPWQVSMTYYGNHRCGGSIIHSKYILTAAHCTSGIMTEVLGIRAGSSMRSYGGIYLTVLQVFQHPYFNKNTMDYDLSIILLGKSLTFGLGINAIDLPAQEEYLRPGSTALVSGWGGLSESGSSASLLQYVVLPIIEHDLCAKAYAKLNLVTDNMICAGFYGIGKKDACQGDSGGPLVANNKLFGVVSWGYGCARSHYPGVYVRVARFRNWIDNVIHRY